MKIAVATGGTGGHIFPALQTAKVLKERGHEVIFVGSLGLGEEKILSQGFKAFNVKAQGLKNRSLGGVVNFGLVMMRAMSQTKKILKDYAPDKVVGFGGYGSFAAVMGAKQLGLPTMIHEQNVVPGKANRFLARLVKKIAVSFPQTDQYFGKTKTIWTGCPCQQFDGLEKRERIFQKFSLDPHKKTILVLGGSQGSQKLNEVFFEMISSLSKKVNVQAIHMTGKKDFVEYSSKYKDQNLPVMATEFISPVGEAYTIADVVIARSGAATVNELGFFVIPSILIPYPLADGHQRYNAEILSQIGLAKIIEQKDLTSDVLQQEIQSILAMPFHKDSFQDKIRDVFKPDPAKELALAIESL